MNNQRIAKELLAVAKDLLSDVGDIKVVEPVESDPVKTRKNKTVASEIVRPRARLTEQR